MKNKNSWDLQDGESIYTKKEIAEEKRKYLSTTSHENTSTHFLCWCGKYHSWIELGTAH